MKRVNKMLVSAYRRALRWRVGTFHVSESLHAVASGCLRSSPDRWQRFRACKRIERRSILAAIAAEHAANRDLYRHVMRGGR